MRLFSIKQILENCKKYKDIDAFIENVNGVYIKHTYEEFIYDIKELVSFIKERNIVNENIAIIGENSYKWIVNFFGIVLSDNIAIPIDKDMVQSDLDKLTKDLKINNAFMSESCLKRIYEIDNVNLISFDKKIRCNSIVDEETLFSYKEEDREKIACIILTSGTSGYNKAVMLSHKNICANMKAIISQDVIKNHNGYLLSMLPMYHSYELFCNVFLSIWYGKTLIIDNDIRHYIKNLVTYQPEIHIVVPSILNFLSKKINALNDVRFTIVVGGAALDSNIYKKMHDEGFEIIAGYGMSEASPLIALKREYSEDPNVSEIFLTNIKIGNMIDDVEGEILIKGDNITSGYYLDPKSTKNSFTEDGWFKTGDLGYIKNNKLHLTGRLKNTIILENGKNVQPEQIEQLIYENLAYVDDVVVTEMSLNNTRVIGAVFYSSYIYLKENVDQLINDIKDINDLLEPHQQISGIAISEDSLPKNKISKIIRKEVKEKLKNYSTFSVR